MHILCAPARNHPWFQQSLFKLKLKIALARMAECRGVHGCTRAAFATLAMTASFATNLIYNPPAALGGYGVKGRSPSEQEVSIKPALQSPAGLPASARRESRNKSNNVLLIFYKKILTIFQFYGVYGFNQKRERPIKNLKFF
ncbi:MAG: hypothetical protein A2W19_16835 [Spirochaetes bacterium RBG_16_49_21]|nr:MAG: hypothetical protein A2W19_16835 [Spirochaetes bacterium RBG_16_49_21]